MTGRFTDEPEYRIARDAEIDGDFARARTNLEALLTKVRASGESDHIDYLLHLLADVEAQSGNTERGHSIYREILARSPNEPFTRIFYARWLVRHFRQAQLAIEQIRIAERLYESGAWRLPDMSQLVMETLEFEIPREIGWIKEEIAGRDG